MGPIWSPSAIPFILKTCLKPSLRPWDISRTSSTNIRQMVIKLHDGTPAALMTLSDTGSQLLQGKQTNTMFILTERTHKQEGDVVY